MKRDTDTAPPLDLERFEEQLAKDEAAFDTGERQCEPSCDCRACLFAILFSELRQARRELEAAREVVHENRRTYQALDLLYVLVRRLIEIEPGLFDNEDLDARDEAWNALRRNLSALAAADAATVTKGDRE